MALYHFDVERGGAPKFSAKFGGDHPGTSVFLLFDVLFLNKNIGNLVVTKESGYFIRAVL